MIITLEMSVAARCTACSVLTPMLGIRNRLSCRNCAAVIDFAARVADSRDGGLRYPFGGYYDAVAEAALVLADGEDCQDARDSNGTPVALKKVAGPACLSCSAALPAPAAGAEAVACATCGDRIAVRWPDDETRTWDPRITCVIGDGRGRGAATREGIVQGALVPCGQCGAPVATTDKEDRRRARPCAHCGAVNFLPDAAWLALFPEPTWHRVFLVYNLDERAVLALYEWNERADKYFLEDDQEAAVAAGFARARAAARTQVLAALARGKATTGEIEGLAIDGTLGDAEAAAVDARLDDGARERLAERASAPLVRRWVGAKSAAVRRIAAAHPALGADQLVTLAADVEASVRAAVAARKETPSATLAQLRKDADSDVVDAVKRNPSYKPGLFERLLG